MEANVIVEGMVAITRLETDTSSPGALIYKAARTPYGVHLGSTSMGTRGLPFCRSAYLSNHTTP